MIVTLETPMAILNFSILFSLSHLHMYVIARNPSTPNFLTSSTLVSALKSLYLYTLDN